MAMYRAIPGTLSVQPTKASFSSDEPVKLRIRCEVERKNGTGSWLTWVTDYLVYKKSGELIKSISRQHSIAPWTELDKAVDDFEEDIGVFTPGILDGTVVVSAHG